MSTLLTSTLILKLRFAASASFSNVFRACNPREGSSSSYLSKSVSCTEVCRANGCPALTIAANRLLKIVRLSIDLSA